MDEDTSPCFGWAALRLGWVGAVGGEGGDCAWLWRRGLIGAWMEDFFVEMDRYAIAPVTDSQWSLDWSGDGRG